MATHPIPERLQGFAAALEASGGTPETISLSTDAIQLIGTPTIEPLFFASNRRDGVHTGTLSAFATPGDPHGEMRRIRFSCEARGAGSAYSASNLPPEDAFLVAAGWPRSVVATSGSESVTYNPTDNPHTGTNDTLTVQAQTANREYILTNAVVEELALIMPVNGIARYEGSIIGVYSSDTEQALEAHTYSTAAPLVWGNTTPISLNNGGAITPTGLDGELRLDFGLNVVTRAYPDASGIAGFKLVDRSPKLTLVGESQAKGSWDPEADCRAATAYTIDTVCGASQYNRLKLNIDAAYLDPEDPPAIQFANNLSHFSLAWIITPPPSGSECAVAYD